MGHINYPWKCPMIEWLYWKSTGDNGALTIFSLSELKGFSQGAMDKIGHDPRIRAAN